MLIFALHWWVPMTSTRYYEIKCTPWNLHRPILSISCTHVEKKVLQSRLLQSRTIKWRGYHYNYDRDYTRGCSSRFSLLGTMLVIRTKEYSYSRVNFACCVANDGRRWNLEGRSRNTQRQPNDQIDWIRVYWYKDYTAIRVAYICVYIYFEN